MRVLQQFVHCRVKIIYGLPELEKLRRRRLGQTFAKARDRQRLGPQEVHNLRAGDLQNLVERNFLESLGAAEDVQLHRMPAELHAGGLRQLPVPRHPPTPEIEHFEPLANLVRVLLLQPEHASDGHHQQVDLPQSDDGLSAQVAPSDADFIGKKDQRGEI